MTVDVAESPDVLVIGGGLVGTAVAYGLAREGAKVTVLDEGDGGFRASRGNFGLVWVQGKGYGLSPYARWTRSSADRWPARAAADRGRCWSIAGRTQATSPNSRPNDSWRPT